MFPWVVQLAFPAFRSLSTASPVVTVTAGMLLQMVLQIGLQAIVSRGLGTSSSVDAYEAAFAIPIVLASMISLPLGAVLIPLVTRTQAEAGDERSAWSAAGTLGIVVIGLTLLITAGLISCRHVLIGVIYDLSPAHEAQAASLLLVLAWLIPANLLVAYCQSLHHWRGSFALPATAGVLGPALTVAMVVINRQSLSVERLAMATVVGAALNVLLQSPPLLRRIRWQFHSNVIKAAGRLTGPVLLGAIYWRIDPLIDRSIGSTFPDDGTIASLGYCGRVTNAMAALAAGGLSVVAFPRMSAAASRGTEDLARETSRALGASLLILAPLAAAWMLFGEAIIRDLFEGGQFTAADTTRVAFFVRCAMGVVVGGSLGEILARTFYSQHQTLLPTLIGTGCVTAGFALKFVFSRIWGPAGVLVASSLAMTASAAIQYFVLSRRLGPSLGDAIARDASNATLATAAACAAGAIILWASPPLPAFIGGAIGLAVYLGTLYLLRSRHQDASP